MYNHSKNRPIPVPNCVFFEKVECEYPALSEQATFSQKTHAGQTSGLGSRSAGGVVGAIAAGSPSALRHE